MLKNKTKFIAILLILILLFSATSVLAENETSDDGIMPISADENEIPIEENTIENENVNVNTSQENNYKKSDVYLTGDNITIDYIIDGNLFVCADTVTINSQIGGDAFVCAKNLIINEEGYIFSNLFAISDSIEIKGVVYDVYALSENLTISKGYIYRDLKALCKTLNINGNIGRNAFVECSDINFNTDGNTNGSIFGNLTYSANAEISIPENIVSGTVSFNPIQKFNANSIQSIILDFGSFIAFLLIIWLLCLWLAPKFLEHTCSYVGKKTLAILGYGLLVLIAVPIVSIILILLQLTSGISFVLLGLYVLAIIISKSLFTITANNYICSKLNINKNLGIFGLLIVSGMVIWAISQIPYVGSIISFITTVLGLGILTCSIIPKKSTKKETID